MQNYAQDDFPPSRKAYLWGCIDVKCKQTEQWTQAWVETVFQGGGLACHSAILPRKAEGNWGIMESSGNKQKVSHLSLSSE